MTRINLLPWREQLRKERERQFYSTAVGAAVFTALLCVYIHFHVSGLIDVQNQRNTFLEQKIKEVEGQIKEIQSLEAEKAQLLARMKVIEELQGQRPQMVHLFDELVRTLPDGVYLTSLKQTGTSLTVDGLAQSNARVSAFMRNIEASHWLTDPHLDVIESSDKDSKDSLKLSKFEMEIKQQAEQTDNNTTAGSAKVRS